MILFVLPFLSLATAVSGQFYRFEDCFEHNVRYNGSSVLDVPFLSTSSNAAECHYTCLRNDRCDYFAFDPVDQRCYIMDDTAMGDRVARDYWVSGPQHCYLPKKGCFDDMTLYRTRTLVIIRDVFSAELCQQLCANHPRCFHFSHRINVGVCRLKEGREGEAPPSRRFFQFVSGPFSCDDDFDFFECEGGWYRGERDPSKCYRASTLKILHANETQTVCRYMRGRRDPIPAEPRTTDQAVDVRAFVTDKTIDVPMWIGLEDRDGDGNFNWVSDGAPLDPALNVFWDRDNPVAGGGHCVSVRDRVSNEDRSGRWENGPCFLENSNLALCEYTLPQPRQ